VRPESQRDGSEKKCYLGILSTRHFLISVTDLKQSKSGLHLVPFQLLLPGGCEGKLKPCTADVCAGIQHAYCDTQLGACLCKPGYEPQYDQHQLLQCSVDGQTTSDDSGAQHKAGTAASIVPPSHQATAPEDKIQSRFYYPRKWRCNRLSVTVNTTAKSVLLFHT
jgi:hypothetical protein